MIRLNDVEIKATIFPDKTSQVWKVEPLLLIAQDFFIQWEFESEAELMHLAQLTRLLGRGHKSLYLPYLPYGRQDKVPANDSTFALWSFAEFINMMNFDKVICFDPHSSVAGDLIFRFLPMYPITEINAFAAETKADCVCFPDKGAVNKYTPLIQRPYIYGDKTRDQLTGQITGYKLHGDPEGKRVLIVDDICDGGGTFVLLAAELISRGVKEIHLYVSHGIFSKGLQVLRNAGIQRIFTKQGEQP